MDAAPVSRDARRCARPGCADVATATLTFRYDLQQAWVLPLTDEASPATYDLCGPCADRTRPPRGWELVDERPDLDASDGPAEQDDAVRAAIAAALRGQAPPVGPVPAAPAPAPAASGTPVPGLMRLVPGEGDARPSTPGAPPRRPSLRPEDLAEVLRAHQGGTATAVATGPPATSQPATVRAVLAPLAFDAVPGRLVSLGLEELGEFDEEDLVAGLRERRDPRFG